MSDQKISADPPATDLVGATFPIIQGGANKQAPVAIADARWASPASLAAAAGFRNRIINGDGRINQRAAVSNADDTYCVDRHYVLTQTGTIAASVLSDVADGLPSMVRLTQSQASAQRMGIATIIEAANCKDLRGSMASLIGKLRCSSSQAIRYAILEWTGAANTVTSDVVNSWTNGTFTAGQFFISSNLTVREVGTVTPAAATLTDFVLTDTLGSSFNNLILFIWTEGTAAQNVTLDVAWEFVKGDVTGQTYPQEVRAIQQELVLCQRYMRKSFALGTAPGTATTTGQLLRKTESSTTYHFLAQVVFSPPMMGTPTITLYNPLDGNTSNPIRDNFGSSHPAGVLAGSDGGFIVEVNNSSIGATANITTQYAAIAEI